MPKALLILLSGPPLSGKSTFLENLKKQLPSIQIISTDDIRLELYGSYDFFEPREPKVWELAHARIAFALERNQISIIDATLRTSAYREAFRSFHEKYPCALIAFEKLSLALLQTRNRQRSWKSFDPKVIERLHAEYLFPVPKEQATYAWFTQVNDQNMLEKIDEVKQHLNPFL